MHFEQSGTFKFLDQTIINSLQRDVPNNHSLQNLMISNATITNDTIDISYNKP